MSERVRRITVVRVHRCWRCDVWFEAVEVGTTTATRCYACDPDAEAAAQDAGLIARLRRRRSAAWA